MSTEKLLSRDGDLPTAIVSKAAAKP